MTAAYRAVPAQARCVRVFPGEIGQVREARSFAGRVLANCPARETLLTCLSELAANAIEHTASGAGGVFTVQVAWTRGGVAFVAVTDGGGAGEPAVRPLDELAEEGRGLALVAALSSRWGYRETGQGHTVWAEATWPVPVRGAGRGRGHASDAWEFTEPSGAA